MRGAKGVLINITGGYDMTLFEVDEAANEIRREVDVDAHIILGSTFDEKMNGKIRVSVVAAGLTPPGVAARPAPHAMREQISNGLSAANLNAPSPAAELGLTHSPPPGPKQPIMAPAPAASYYEAPPQAPAPQREHSQPTPIIRPRPAPEQNHAPPPAPKLEPSPEPAPEQSGGRSFASLFGWKSKPQQDEPAAAPPPRPAEEESFDDELEIPAFLRRSGNA
jgi:cell division protein FtsZ